MVGTPNYISPEGIYCESPSKQSSDVFSFSIIMLECLLGMTARKISTTGNAKDALHKLHVANKRYEISPAVQEKHPALVELIYCCWSADATARPTFDEIAELLPQIVRKEVTSPVQSGSKSRHRTERMSRARAMWVSKTLGTPNE